MENISTKILMLLLIIMTFNHAKAQQTQNNNSTVFGIRPLIWLRADIPGDSMELWADYSGNFHNATVAGGVLISSGEINFHPAVIRHKLDTAIMIPAVEITGGSGEVFVVYHSSDTTGESGIWMIKADSSYRTGLSTLRIIGKRDIKYTDSTDTTPIINAMSIRTGNGNKDTINTNIIIGGTDSLGYEGVISEFIFFGSRPSYSDREKIHSYLALKYGITISRYNYVNSKDSIIWDTRDEALYNHDVAGIIRDDSLLLNIKQSGGRGGKCELTMYSGLISTTNAQNQTVLPQNTGMIWGHNGEGYSIETDSIEDTTAVGLLTMRRWKIKMWGDSARKVPVMIKLRRPEEMDSGTVMLVIEPREDGSFRADSVRIIAPSTIDTNGNIYYGPLYWDSDGSGSDMFAFKTDTSTTSQFYDVRLGREEIKRNRNLKVRIYPNPNDGTFQIQIFAVESGRYKLLITDASGKQLENKDLEIDNFKWLERELETPGVYIIKVGNSSGSVIKKVVVK
jgi:hypothetical protein